MADLFLINIFSFQSKGGEETNNELLFSEINHFYNHELTQNIIQYIERENFPNRDYLYLFYTHFYKFLAGLKIRFLNEGLTLDYWDLIEPVQEIIEFLSIYKEKTLTRSLRIEEFLSTPLSNVEKYMRAVKEKNL